MTMNPLCILQLFLVYIAALCPIIWREYLALIVYYNIITRLQLNTSQTSECLTQWHPCVSDVPTCDGTNPKPYLHQPTVCSRCPSQARCMADPVLSKTLS
jgi:hypothetical protein